jgi:hypothetical protein
MEQYAYYGAGKAYLRVAGASAGLKELGNVSALAFNVTPQQESLPDYTQPGGGTYAEIRRIESVEASITMHDLNPHNVALALLGGSAAVTGASVVDEAHTGYKSGFIKLAHPGPYTGVVVTGAGGTPTYVADTDYEVRAGGIFVLAAGAITDGLALLIDYTYVTYDKVEAITEASKEYEIVFDGLNEARSGKRVRVDAYKVRLSPTQTLDLISQSFGELQVTGTVLKDTSKTGAGISQYFKASMER